MPAFGMFRFVVSSPSVGWVDGYPEYLHLARTVAITPSKSSRYPTDEVLRVCQTSTLVGLRVMHEAGVAKPFRFLYVSRCTCHQYI